MTDLEARKVYDVLLEIIEAGRLQWLRDQVVEEAQLPKKVISWSAETIGTDSERKRFKTKQPRDGQISLLADFAEIFRRIHDKREIPARREARELGKRFLGAGQQTPKRDRLEMGVPWQILVEWMAICLLCAAEASA